MHSTRHPSYARLARQALQIAMSDYSENYWAAGWLSDIEFQLWDDVLKLRSGKRLARWKPEPEFLTLSLLSEIADGWWYWGNSGLKFVSMKQWLVKYEKHQQAPCKTGRTATSR